VRKPCALAPANVLEALSADPDVANPAFPYISRVRITVPCFTETVKSGVAGNTATPTALLERLARDPDCAVRRKVATNKNVPAGILQALQNDAEPAVKTSAMMALQAPRARP